MQILLRHFGYAAFQTISVIISTGYGIDDFSLWPLFLPVLLIFSTFMGGCAGSTVGGMKVIRFLLLIRQGRREIYRLVHPQIVQALKVNGRPVPEEVISAVWGYMLLFIILMMLLMAGGMDQITAFGAVATCLNNVGPGLGEVATNFTSVSDGSKWLLCFAMLAGRLELFTVLVLFSRMFWRS